MDLFAVSPALPLSSLRQSVKFFHKKGKKKIQHLEQKLLGVLISRPVSQHDYSAEGIHNQEILTEGAFTVAKLCHRGGPANMRL